ncbi:HNH endonuclease [Azospirillum sp. Vi22]|uniref:HNH endonuclease n=1 Tax=Azospirillum baldaniorum TaxID=1064539 RepID=UPI0034E21EEC|nr:HNH endonuclease [Azospirillum baldaniorum]
MPSAPPRLCPHHGPFTGPRCPSCSKTADRARGTRHARGYDSGWVKLRAAHLARHSACLVCGTTMGVDVDHVQAIREAPNRRLDPTNLRTLCRLHHNRKTHGKGVKS